MTGRPSSCFHPHAFSHPHASPLPSFPHVFPPPCSSSSDINRPGGGSATLSTLLTMEFISTENKVLQRKNKKTTVIGKPAMTFPPLKLSLTVTTRSCKACQKFSYMQKFSQELS